MGKWLDRIIALLLVAAAITLVTMAASYAAIVENPPRVEIIRAVHYIRVDEDCFLVRSEGQKPTVIVEVPCEMEI